MQFRNVGAAYTTVFAQKFDPELRLIGFLQSSVNFRTELGIGSRSRGFPGLGCDRGS
jgi:hypothetical protein